MLDRLNGKDTWVLETTDLRGYITFPVPLMEVCRIHGRKTNKSFLLGLSEVGKT